MTENIQSRMSVMRIQISLVLLHLAAVSGQYTSFLVRNGDEVTLPCENVTHNQNGCENTHWLFSGAGDTAAVQLVTLRQVGGDESDRLSVTENCCLRINTVTMEDVGRYSCRRFKSGQQQGPNAYVYLSVIDTIEYKDSDSVTFTCLASTYAWCTQRLTWLFENEDQTDVRTSESYCATNVTFRTSKSRHIQTSRSGLLTCEATDIFTGRVRRFIFSPQSLGEEATTARTTERSTNTVFANNDATKSQVWWRYTVVSVGLAALILIVVAVNMWTRAKGRKTETAENTVNLNEDDGTVNYENL